MFVSIAPIRFSPLIYIIRYSMVFPIAGHPHQPHTSNGGLEDASLPSASSAKTPIPASISGDGRTRLWTRQAPLPHLPHKENQPTLSPFRVKVPWEWDYLFFNFFKFWSRASYIAGPLVRSSDATTVAVMWPVPFPKCASSNYIAVQTTHRYSMVYKKKG